MGPATLPRCGWWDTGAKILWSQNMLRGGFCRWILQNSSDFFRTPHACSDFILLYYAVFLDISRLAYLVLSSKGLRSLASWRFIQSPKKVAWLPWVAALAPGPPEAATLDTFGEDAISSGCQFRWLLQGGCRWCGGWGGRFGVVWLGMVWFIFDLVCSALWLCFFWFGSAL